MKRKKGKENNDDNNNDNNDNDKDNDSLKPFFKGTRRTTIAIENKRKKSVGDYEILSKPEMG